jgi:predicted nucleic acid-binding protein
MSINSDPSGIALNDMVNALDGLTRLGIDTSPFIYYIEAHPQYEPVVHSVVERIRSGALVAYSSVITLTEILSRPTQLGMIDLVSQYRYLLLNSRIVE